MKLKSSEIIIEMFI